MIKPTIHSNGTSADSLLRQYLDAAEKLCTACDAIAALDINGRDYYPQGEAAIKTAVSENRVRVEMLTAIVNELNELAAHCQDAIDDKAKRLVERMREPT